MKKTTGAQEKTQLFSSREEIPESRELVRGDAHFRRRHGLCRMNSNRQLKRQDHSKEKETKTSMQTRTKRNIRRRWIGHGRRPYTVRKVLHIVLAIVATGQHRTIDDAIGKG